MDVCKSHVLVRQLGWYFQRHARQKPEPHFRKDLGTLEPASYWLSVRLVSLLKMWWRHFWKCHPWFSVKKQISSCIHSLLGVTASFPMCFGDLRICSVMSLNLLGSQHAKHTQLNIYLLNESRHNTKEITSKVFKEGFSLSAPSYYCSAVQSATIRWPHHRL